MSEREFEVKDQGELDLFAFRAPSAGSAQSESAQPSEAPEQAGSGGWPEDDWVPVDPDWEPDGHVRDPETDPDDEESWLSGLPADVRAEFLAGPWTGEGEAIPAGFLHHMPDGPAGVGFAAGGPLDTLEPGPFLDRQLVQATAGGYEQLGESELIGVLCGWRRMSSQAAAGETAAVIALARRRRAQSREPGREHLLEHVGDELAAALTLTGRSADRLLTIAGGLDRLRSVLTALEHGEIDWAKACLFTTELDVLADDDAAQEIAARFLGGCGPGGWTTGQLRAALRRAVLAVDPGAADRRRQAARKDAEVQVWEEASGNAGLVGRELPPAEVLAADARLTALARWLQRRGADGTVAQLRPRIYLALLACQPVETLLHGPDTGAESAGSSDRRPAAGGDDSEPSAGSDDPDPSAGSNYLDPSAGGNYPDPSAGSNYPDPFAGSNHPDPDLSAVAEPGRGTNGADPLAGAARPGRSGSAGWPPVTGTIHLTLPMSSWLGLDSEPGEVAGHGPLDAASSRDLVAALAGSPVTRWCLTLTDPSGHPAAHACARRGPTPGQPPVRWAAGLRARLRYLETDPCGHGRVAAGYRPPATLRHLVQIRQRTCTFPGCRRPAARCDLDHTHPYDQGGLTCECNLAPLCRRHHQAKQAPGWQLTQTEPGRMTWRTPAGRGYQTTGAPYP